MYSKFKYIFYCLIAGISVSSISHAQEAGNYQVMPVHLEWTKASLLAGKEPFVLLPFELPPNFPDDAVFLGMRGTISTETKKAVDASGKDITDSVALITLSSSTTNLCPSMGEQNINNSMNVYKSLGYQSAILKQSVAGTKTLDLDSMLTGGIPIQLGTKKCMFFTFDGWDVNKQDFKLNIDLDIKYRAKTPKTPVRIKLEVEGTAGAPDAGYLAYPVSKEGNPKNSNYLTINGNYNVLPAGTITAVYGNVAAVNTKLPDMKNWSVRSNVAVYKKESCAKAFLNHGPGRFQWQDSKQSTLWPTSTIVADTLLQGHGKESVLAQVKGNNQLPIHVEAGDCVVHSFINDSDKEYYHKGYVNEEAQVSFLFIPD